MIPQFTFIFFKMIATLQPFQKIESEGQKAHILLSLGHGQKSKKTKNEYNN